MKIRLLLILTLFVAPCACAIADTSSVTPALGYFKLSARGASDSFVSIPLEQRSVGLARVTAVTANTLRLNSSGWADDRFVPETNGSFYVQFLTGQLKGAYYKITGNIGPVVSLDTQGDDLSAHALGSVIIGDSGDLVRIRPFWTINGVFGADETSLSIGTGFGNTGFAYTEGDAVLLYDNVSTGTAKLPAKVINYISGTGWRSQGSSTDVGEQEIRPGEAIVIRRQGATPAEITVIGGVPNAPLVSRIPSLAVGQEIDLAIALAHPTELRIADAQLYSATAPSVFNATTDPRNPSDLLLDFSSNRLGFSLLQNDRLFVTGDHWVMRNAPADDFSLRPGIGYILRLRGARSVQYWIQNPTY